MVLSLDYINCTRCVVHGDVSSHVLFSLFINELALVIINGRHVINLSSNFVPLVILLFADDLIFLSETIIGLQTRIDSLFSSPSILFLLSLKKKKITTLNIQVTMASYIYILY